MRINILRGNTLTEQQEKRAVRLWDSYQELWWRLCYICHQKKQTGQSVTEYTPRNPAVLGGSLDVTWFMVCFPKCFTWLFLTLILARFVGVKLFGKITGYFFVNDLIPIFVSMKDPLDIFGLTTCRRFITFPGCSRLQYSLWRAVVPLAFGHIWCKVHQQKHLVPPGPSVWHWNHPLQLPGESRPAMSGRGGCTAEPSSPMEQRAAGML